MDEETVLKLAVATLYYARITKGAADAFIKSEEFSREGLAHDAELEFNDLEEVWEALPKIEKCLRLEIPDILNHLDERLEAQLQRGEVMGLGVAHRFVMEEAVALFSEGDQDSEAAAVRLVAEKLKKRYEDGKYELERRGLIA